MRARYCALSLEEVPGGNEEMIMVLEYEFPTLTKI